MLLMMNLKVRRCAACLASPAIPLQHFLTKLLVRFRIQPQAWLLWSNLIHDASESPAPEMPAAAVRVET